MRRSWPALVLFAIGSLAIAFAARTRSNVKPDGLGVAARPRAGAPRAGIGIAIGATAAATIALLLAQQAAGLAPVRDAWSASVGALVAWQAFHGVVLALMAALRCSHASGADA